MYIVLGDDVSLEYRNSDFRFRKCLNQNLQN